MMGIPSPTTQCQTGSSQGWPERASTHQEVGPPSPTRNSTTSFLTATTKIYAIGAGITAAAGTLRYRRRGTKGGIKGMLEDLKSICARLVCISTSVCYSVLCCLLTRLALQLILDKGFKLFSFQLPDLERGPALLFIVTTSLNNRKVGQGWGGRGGGVSDECLFVCFLGSTLYIKVEI